MSKGAAGKANDALSPDFLDFITALTERRVDFVLIGGYALGVHGVIRATADIDFLYRRTKTVVRRLCAALHDFGLEAQRDRSNKASTGREKDAEDVRSCVREGQGKGNNLPFC